MKAPELETALGFLRFFLKNLETLTIVLHDGDMRSGMTVFRCPKTDERPELVETDGVPVIKLVISGNPSKIGIDGTEVYLNKVDLEINDITPDPLRDCIYLYGVCRIDDERTKRVVLTILL